MVSVNDDSAKINDYVCDEELIQLCLSTTFKKIGNRVTMKHSHDTKMTYYL